MRKITAKLLPPILKDIITKIHQWNKRRRLKYDPRRWDEDVVKSSSGKEFVKIINFENIENPNFFSVRFEEEIKDFFIIPPNKKIKFNLKNEKELSKIVFSFAHNDLKTLKGNYQLIQENKVIANLQNPRSKSWNRIWINFNGSKNFEIKNNTNKNMFFAQPTYLYEDKNDDEKIKNIFLIVLDQVDQKTFNELYEDNELPNVKKFFEKNSLHYSNCISPGEWTVPSFNSIFTGQSPSEHGFYDLKYSSSIKNIIPENNLFSLLRKNNFHSFGIIKSKGHNQNYQVHGYFDRYLFYEDIPNKTDNDDDKFISRTIDNLEVHKNNKNFTFIHFMKTHSPYYLPSYYEERYLSNNRISDPDEEFNKSQIGTGDTKIEVHLDEKRFNNEIRLRQKIRLKRIDMILGQLFDYISKNFNKKCLTILTADHGLPHGIKQSKILNDNWINIPFKVNLSDIENYEFREYKNFVSTADIFNLTKYLVNNENNKDLIYPFNDSITEKDNFAISESIFNKIYKVAVGNNCEIFRFACYFDPIKKTVFTSKVIKKNLYKNGKEISLGEDRLHYFLDLIKNNLKKSKYLNIKS